MRRALTHSLPHACLAGSLVAAVAFMPYAAAQAPQGTPRGATHHAQNLVERSTERANEAAPARRHAPLLGGVCQREGLREGF